MTPDGRTDRQTNLVTSSLLELFIAAKNYEYKEQLCEPHHHMQEYHLNHFLQSHIHKLLNQKNNYSNTEQLCEHHYHMEKYHLNNFHQSQKHKLHFNMLIFSLFHVYDKVFLNRVFPKLRLNLNQIVSLVPIRGRSFMTSTTLGGGRTKF